MSTTPEPTPRDDGAMQPRLSFDRTVITTNTDEQVHTLVEFTAPAAQPIDRPAIDVVFVIDRSGSMSGAPLAAVKQAVHDVIRHLGNNDRCAVVTFGSDSETVIGLDRHTDQAALQAVRNIECDGMTNLSSGWLRAVDILNGDPRPDTLRRIVVLTDGHVNRGITEHDDLGDMVTRGRGNSITTSLIGFADGYDEELVGALANAGGGNDYWCEGADAAGAVFDTEFDGLGRVVAQNVTIEVRPTPAVAVAGVMNDFAVTPLSDPAFRVDLGDAYGDETRSVLLAFNTRPQPAGGTVEVAQLTLSWVDVTSDFAAHTVTVPITVTAGASGTTDSGADPRVVDEVRILEAARDRREARRLADDGDTDAARRLLNRASDGLASVSGFASRTARTEIREDLDALEANAWSGMHSKRAYSTTREMSRKRSSSFRNAQPDDNPFE
ncbi:MAG: vWA domain-containing protein [Ilumatobacteraceae bacterium]